MKLIQLLTATTLVVLLATGCTSSEESKAEEAFLNTIKDQTDCKYLQDAFNNAKFEHEQLTKQDAPLGQREAKTANMRAADKRLEEVGCYKK